jgi:membrane protease YdiL (CAAX protease family)
MQAAHAAPTTIAILLVGTLFLALGTVGFFAARVMVRKLVPESAPRESHWRWRHLAFALGVAALLVLARRAMLLDVRPEGTPEPALPELLGRMLSIELPVCALLAYFAWKTFPAKLRGFGIARGGNLRAIGAGLSAHLLCLPLIFGAALLWKLLLDRCGIASEPEFVMQKLVGLPHADRGIVVLFGAVLVPLCEEIGFRVFLQSLLTVKFGPRTGLIVTSIVFGALHGLRSAVPIFVLSLLLGWIWMRTQRLAGSLCMHALQNGSMFLILFLAQDAGMKLDQYL